MKPIKSSGMPLFLMLLGLTIFTDIITRLNGKPRSATIVTIWAIVSLMLLYPRWCVYYITPEGFQRKYLGLFPMKDISWKEIRDVERTAGRGTTLLLVSTIYVRYPMPDKQTKKLKELLISEFDFNRFRSFYLDDTPEILDCIYKYHGKLSNYEPK
ncbi:MAG: hypothetical protein SOR87_04050 [Vescimonas coprocola]|nr:hypothetical protein [Vescimonas coprocola]